MITGKDTLRLLLPQFYFNLNKMKYRCLLFMLLCIHGASNAQEFQTSFFLVKADGSKDSTVIGFDPNAADGIDPNFGEINLLHMPMQNFELRTGQVYNERMTYFEDLEHPVLDSLAQYAGKTEIIPKECLYFVPVSNQAGFLPSINLFIKTDAYPVVLKWDKQAFDNACVSMSFITDWPITTWWDIPCCNPLDVGRVNLTETDSITLTSHSGIHLVDGLGDTLTMLTILLQDELGTSVSHTKDSEYPMTFPNPSNGSLTIPEGWQLLDISSVSGTNVIYQMHGTTVYTNYEGLLLLTLRKGREIIVLKHINGRRN